MNLPYQDSWGIGILLNVQLLALLVCISVPLSGNYTYIPVIPRDM